MENKNPETTPENEASELPKKKKLKMTSTIFLAGSPRTQKYANRQSGKNKNKKIKLEKTTAADPNSKSIYIISVFIIYQTLFPFSRPFSTFFYKFYNMTKM